MIFAFKGNSVSTPKDHIDAKVSPTILKKHINDEWQGMGNIYFKLLL